MADNQNTNPKNTPSDLDRGTKDLLKNLKERLDREGDLDYILKDQVKEITKLDTAYKNINARLKSLNDSSINIKQVQSELYKLKQKEIIAQRNLEDVQQGVSKETKAQLDLAKQIDEKLKGQLTKKERNKLLEQQKAAAAAMVGNTELAALATAQKAVEVAKSNVEEGKKYLSTEKSVSRQLGISGNLIKILSDKIGIGSEAMEAMSLKAREVVDSQKKMNFFGKIFSTTLGFWKVSFAGINSIVKSAFSSLLDPAAIIGGIGLFAKLVKDAFDYIVGIQDKTVKFARAMNMSTEQARQLKMQYADINIANGDLFVNTQKLVEAQTEMVDLLGVTNQISTANLATNIKLKDIAGLEADTIASITESSIINGKSNESIVKSVFAQVKGLKQATGIQFENKKILKEASSLGGVLGLQFSKYPAQLTKSLLTVKAMGLELKQVDAMADSFLDFESSISKEFEAQLLTGKDINLAKAREAFLNNDLATAASEINRQVGSTADFMKMNRIQQEALANAMGMNRDQMGDMLKKQEMLSKLGAKDTDNAREQLRLGLEKYKNQQALSEAIGEENYQNLVNASLQEKIGAFMEKIKQSISDFVEKSGIIGKIEKMMDWLSKPENIRSVMIQVRDVFASIIGAMGKVAAVIMKGANWFGAGIDESTIEAAMNAGDSIRSMGGDLSFVAAKERAGAGGTAGNSSTGGASNYSSAIGASQPSVEVSIDGRSMFLVSYGKYNSGANSDQQLSTKYSTNPTQH